MPVFAVAQPRDDAQDLQGFAPGAPAAPIPFWDAVSSTFDNSWQNGRLGGREDALADAFQQRHQEVERRLGLKFDFPNPGDAPETNPSLYVSSLETGGAGDEAAIDGYRAKFPQAMAGVPTATQVQQQVDAQLNATAQRAGLAGQQQPVAGFLGGLGGSLADPFNAGVALSTGPFAEGPLAFRMIAQSLIWGGAAALQAPARAAEAQSVGGPAYGLPEALQDVGGGLLAGPLFEGGGAVLRGLARPILRALAPEAAPLAEAALADAVHADPVARGASMALDQAGRDAAAVGEARSGADFDAGLYSLASGGDPLPLPEGDADVDDLFANPSPVIHGPDAQPIGVGPREDLGNGATVYDRSDYRGRPIYAASFDPAEVGTAAQTFQYKSDADAAGVTDRLRGVTAWDPTSSGKVIVYQPDHGPLVIADGHQRLGLARRLLGQGFPARLDGMLFRQADGWSPVDVRTIAALKNIREGQGSPLDAAKVFRDRPLSLNDDSLPVSGGFIRQAKGLARLSPEAFGAVVNHVIPEPYGAAIGELAGARPDLHAGLVRLLHAGEPASLDEAHALVHEALLDDWTQQQGSEGDLFGDTPAQSLAIARARLKAWLVRALRGDARLMAQLVRHADAIEAGGNVLARDANEAGLAVNQAALEIVSKLGMRAGPVGEAMTEASHAIQSGARPADAGKGVLSRIRGALKRGETLDLARAATLDPAPPSPGADARAAAFSEVGGKGQAAQIAPKPEDAAAAEAPAGAATFKTAKGSTYVVDDAGRTTRDKSFHPEHGAADVGPQPASERTVYVTPDDARMLGEIQTTGAPGRRLADVGDGRVGVQYRDGKFERRTVVASLSAPAKGLIPVELWDGGQRVHFGNEIVEVSEPGDAPAPEPPALPTSKLPEDDLFGGIEDDAGPTAAIEHLKGCAPGGAE